MKINIKKSIADRCPQLQLRIITCKVKNSASTDELWEEIDKEILHIKDTYSIDQINKRPAISATRSVYKSLGKDPNRYRPSAEALCRRIVRGIHVYKVSTLVDIINLVSIRSGYSIGGFDAGKIQGRLELGIGTADEQFEAIGRGLLNIEGLPLYSDETGGIGTPTSDSERTKITDDTTNLLLIINGYGGNEGLDEAVQLAKQLLTDYAGLQDWNLYSIP